MSENQRGDARSSRGEQEEEEYGGLLTLEGLAQRVETQARQLEAIEREVRVSGDEIVAGDITSGESTTFLNGQGPSEADVGFGGDVIFQVGPHIGGALQPINPTLHAIRGTGFGSGGVGVIGAGSETLGIGLHGEGFEGVVGQCNTPTGGPLAVGVRGVGASSPGGTPDSPGPDPSAGVLGEGGRQNDVENTARASHGAGVVGVAGASPFQNQPPRPLPPFEETAHVGVFGLGGDAERRGSIPGVPGVSGPENPGPGVLGHGGMFRDEISGDLTFTDGPGVAGISGRMPIPPLKDMLNGIGVFGLGTNIGVEAVGGPTGVRAYGTDAGVRALGEDAGVRGVSGGEQGRGGIFASTHQAQVQLEPQQRPTTPEPLEGHTPLVLPTVEPPAELPVDGRAGDLVATRSVINDESGDPRSRATLWFCARGQDADASASWREVLMGPEFPGTQAV